MVALSYGKHHGFSHHGFSRVFKSLLGVYPPILSNVWSNNMLFLFIFRVLEATLAQKHLATGLIRAWPQAGRGKLARCIFLGDARVLIRV